MSEIKSSLQPLTHHFSSLSIIILLLPKHVIISICGKTKYAAPYSILSTLHFKTHCFRFLPFACCYLLPFCSTFVCLFVCLFLCLFAAIILSHLLLCVPVWQHPRRPAFLHLQLFGKTGFFNKSNWPGFAALVTALKHICSCFAKLGFSILVTDLSLQHK